MNSVQLELKAIKRQWLDDAASQFALFAHKLGLFTFDDMHQKLPTPEHPNWYGILAAKLKNEGHIRRVTATPSRRPSANGRLVSVWEVVS
jgi:hypothetical protein